MHYSGHGSRFMWVVLMLAALLLGTAWILESRTVRAPGAGALEEAPAVGHKAPDFTLNTLAGDEIQLSNLRGRPVVVNFWATWCPPCRAEIPFFQEANRKYNGQAVILGVDDGEPRETVARFAGELGMTYPIPLDEEGVVSRQYRANSLPTTYFIDRNGVIQHLHIGIINQAVLESQIEQLLKE